MSPTPSPRAPAVVNEDIRALWAGRGGDPRVRLTATQRELYERLLIEWEAAVRADIVTAA
ncbi:hypothetical protein [Streptomyces sp. MNP-20]|uniref:hypothetical protein n=1 Tax=Streptomyces sp. MNP-20 TaxID=2721165 RepID=UPI00155498D9|nr:hypothetical protein [Streptomyces sp. MNP-20]